MAESSLRPGMAETEVSALKNALSAKQQALQKLQAELEKEREASASAASEALSMILRLQGERAAEKMEAHQYKRMTEEKMQLANESLAVFEELMHGKEMEVASLEYQVQAYRQKLSSVGFINLGIGDKKFADHGTVRRNASLPVIRFKGSKHKSGVERIPPTLLPEDTAEDASCNLEQTDECVKESSHDKPINEGIQSTWDSKNKNTQATNKSFLESLNKSTPSCSSSQAEHSEKGLEFDAESSRCLGPRMVGSSMPSTSIHDIFEIPQNYGIQQLREPQRKVKQVLCLEGENRPGKPDSVQFENGKFHFKDENQWIKKAVLYATDKSKLSTPENGVKIEYFNFWPRLESKIGIAPSQAEVQQLDKRLQLVEDEFLVVKKESSDRMEEELKLLLEIREQLKTIQSQIRSLKPKKSSPDDSLMVSVMEVCLHCTVTGP